MSELRTIEIDFDVHQMIEMERQSFMESPNDVLRRLLKIGERSSGNSVPVSEGRSWSGKGVTLPHGTELRMEYRGRQYSGVIDNGADGGWKENVLQARQPQLRAPPSPRMENAQALTSGFTGTSDAVVTWIGFP